MASISQTETAALSRRKAWSPNFEARDVLISMNPRAGARARHEHVESIAAALRQANFQVHVTTNLDDLNGLARDGLNSGRMRAVVAVGGDGTASIVRNHVPLELPLLVVPMGTENLLGRFVRQATDPTSVCNVLENGVVAELDLGRAEGKYFLLMMSAGFDAEVIRSLHENRRGNISHRSYVLPTVRSIMRYGYPEMQLYCEPSQSADVGVHRCRWMFGFNLPLYALGLTIAPNAVATDGLLDICCFERGAVWSVARYLWHIMQSGHHQLADAKVSQTRRFRLEPVDGATVPYQLDGDYAGTLPAEAEVLSGQLRLLVSRDSARLLGLDVPADL
jgi:diacylglycerol kinase family enzyme